MGNDPINVCTPAIQRCQPGPASPNTCTVADNPVTCGGTTPICCKEIPGSGALPFTCVANASDCPTDTCLDGDEECQLGTMKDFCCDGKCFESEPSITTL